MVTTHRTTCRACDAPVWSRTKGRVYCGSPACHAKTWKPEVKKCGICQASFTQARKWQVTCSDECALERKRRADRAKALAGTKWKGDRFDAFPVLARGARLARGRGMGSAWIARALEARGCASMSGSA